MWLLLLRPEKSGVLRDGFKKEDSMRLDKGGIYG
jgi:hypothetical protein